MCFFFFFYSLSVLIRHCLHSHRKFKAIQHRKCNVNHSHQIEWTCSYIAIHNKHTYSRDMWREWERMRKKPHKNKIKYKRLPNSILTTQQFLFYIKILALSFLYFSIYVEKLQKTHRFLLHANATANTFLSNEDLSVWHL